MIALTSWLSSCRDGSSGSPQAAPSRPSSPTFTSKRAEQQVLRVEVVQQRLQPVEQQEFPVVAGDADLQRAATATTVPRSSTMAENSAAAASAKRRVQVGGADAQAEVGGVVEGFDT